MTQRIKPDRPIWPTVPGDTRPEARTTPAGTRTRTRDAEDRGQQGQSVPPTIAESFGSFAS